MYVTESLVWCTFEFVGFHRWPEAAQVLPDRWYLAEAHRHKFFVRVEVSVTSANRQIEFQELKDNAEAFVALERAGSNWLDTMSCEMMARSILGWLVGSYPNRRHYSVSVSEDNENGATVVSRGVYAPNTVAAPIAERE